VLEIDKKSSFALYQPVEIKIIGEPVVKKRLLGRMASEHYSINITYEYEIFGKKYVGHRVSFGNTSSNIIYNSKYKKEMEDIKNYILREKKAYIDPADHTYAVLIPRDMYEKTHMEKGQWYHLDIALMCLFLAMWIMFCIMTFIQNIYEKSGKTMSVELFILPIFVVSLFVGICVLFMSKMS
jgi:hypothetical protein